MARGRNRRRRILTPSARIATRSVGALSLVLLAATGCSTAADRSASVAEQQLEEQLDPDGNRDLDVEIDPETTIIRVEDASSGDIFVDGDGQDRPPFLDSAIPLPTGLEITWSSVQEDIIQVEGQLSAGDVDELTPLYREAATLGGWTVESDPAPLFDEDVIMLAYMADDVPLDVRVDGTTFTLFAGRYWE